MSIKSPETYGDVMGRSQFDANIAFEEEIEKSIKSFIPSLFGDIGIRESVPFDILPKLERLFEFEHPGLGSVGGRFVSEAADNVVGRLLDSALKNFGWESNKRFADERVTIDHIANLYKRKKLSPEFTDRRFREWGYSEGEQMVYQEATRPFPTFTDLVRWGRYFAGEDRMKEAVEAVYDVSDADWLIWKWLSEQVFTTDQTTMLFRRGVISETETDERLTRIGWSGGRAADVIDISWTIPNAMLTIQGNLHNEIGTEKILEDLAKADIHPDWRQNYLDAVLTKPASIDLVSYHLRQENDLSGLENDLRRIGIHPDYFDIYKTLANRIPPVADIITMAVREAFNPTIAARFGQYEDFPDDFGKYAQQQGLSLEWARRYWAAHWGLPSPQQGFEMLHRGVIGSGDLDLLMKAQDIMPFWRDKMTAIAYRPLTRVDVRRMYKEGILDEGGVYQAYQDAGYSDENARNMTEFTISYVLSQQSKFTTADVVKAYTDRMIERGEAHSLLGMLGVRSGDADYILATAAYKRQWALTDTQTSAIRNLYKRGVYDDNKARSELLRLDMPADHVNSLMEQWWYDRKTTEGPTWTKAETFKYLKNGLITLDRATRELIIMGYDNEHIDIYLKAGGWKLSDNSESQLTE